MSSLKILVAAAAALTVSLSFAQGTPPHPAANPAIGAGQRSTDNTPMGTTGTPGGPGMRAQGTMGAGTAASTTASDTMSGSSSTMSRTDRGASSMNSSGGSHKAKSMHKRRKHHVAKADRN